MSKNIVKPLSSNSPQMELTKENDCFDVLDKANFISELLTTNNEILGDNKMVVLYGGWGSGKSTVMKHIKVELEKKKFPVVFFEAWRYEKDNNLPLSLIAAICSEMTKIGLTSQVDELKKIGLLFLKSVFSSVEFEAKVFGSGVKVSPKQYIENYDRELENIEKAYSAFDHLKEFEEKFRKVEENFLKAQKSDKLIVFIDDLDRCEPEHTLGLLTAIKLFFTYGDNTIFVCGVDKDAIKKALLTKYGDIIKAEEYLEKVFDISFTMPEPISLYKMIGLTLFDGFSEDSQADSHADTAKFIEEFFRSIGFTNARHVKKVLNKFELVKRMANTLVDSPLRAVIPPNLDKDKWEIVLTLYFIILFEFQYDKFLELENWEIKKSSYAQSKIEQHRKETSQPSPTSQYLSVNRFYSHIATIALSNLNTKDGKSVMQLLLIFMPKQPNFSVDLTENIDQIPMTLALFDSEKNTMLVKFCLFLFHKITSEPLNSPSEFIIWNYFKMARTMF